MPVNTIAHQSYNQQSGFSLIEIAIVLIIFGLLLTMFLTPLGTQRNLQNRAKTNVLLDTAKEALFGYAIVNGHLPCPDTDAVPDGIENRNSAGDCANDNGVLAWDTLGITKVDAWDHYFTYRVDATFSNSTSRFTINDAESSSGININGMSGNALVSTNSLPVLVVVSHGGNGFGAINTSQNATVNNEPAPTNVEELENTDNDVTFVSHPPTADGFDDQLIWISPKVLINRMIMAERLP